MLVDTQGLLMLAVVHPADTADRDSERLVLACMFGLYPYLQKLFADGGYQGPQFRKGLTKMLPRLSVDIVEHSHSSKSFEELPDVGSLNGALRGSTSCRWLAKDFENRRRNALSFLRLASIPLMLRKLCNPA